MREFRTTMIKEFDVCSHAPDSTGTSCMLRVYTDHEPAVRPMFYMRLECEEGDGLHGVPVVDLNAEEVANAILAAQGELARRVRVWETKEEARAKLAAFSLPRTVHVR